MKSSLNKKKIEIPKEIFENIFFENGGQKLTKSLTGNYQFGIDPSKPYIEPNAEVEKGEYIQDSQGVREVQGSKHEQGGVKVRLEDFSKVLSDNLEVGDRVVEEIKDVFGIKVSKKDTYAKVLDKVFKHIGLSKLIDEQEKVIDKLAKQQRETKDAETLALNTEILSAKINDLENKKNPLEDEVRKVFDYLFQKQEQSKGNDTTTDVFQDGGIYGAQPYANVFWNVPENSNSSFANPNVQLRLPSSVRNFTTPPLNPLYSDTPQNVVETVTPTQDISEEVVVDPINEQTTTESESQIEGTSNSGSNTYALGIVNPYIKDEYIKYQPNTGRSNKRGIFGTEVDKELSTKETARILPSLYETYFEEGSITPKDVINFQTAYNRFSMEADSALKQFYGEDSEDYAQASKFLADNRFDSNDESSPRYLDNKYGNFTSTRPSVAVKMIPKEELEKLQKEGINTTGQLRERYPEIYNKYNKGVDFPDDVWLAPTDYPSADDSPSNEEVVSEEGDAPTGTVEDRNNLNVQQQDRMGVFLAPDQTPLPPDSLQAHLKTTRRYERLDYKDISPEQQLVELNKQVERSENNLDMMPPQQRAALSANMLATQADATNKLLFQAQQVNQQGRQQIENANAQIQMRENIANAQDALNYEQRQLLAEAKTDADLRNFYNTLQRNNLMNFNTINDLNLSNALYDNFQFTDRGIEAKGGAPQWVVNWWNENTKGMTKREQQEFFKNRVEGTNLRG